MSGRNSRLSTFGSKLFLIFTSGVFYQEFFPDNVPCALPAGALFGSLRRETNRAARVVTANGPEFARIPTFCAGDLSHIIGPNRPGASGPKKRKGVHFML